MLSTPAIARSAVWSSLEAAGSAGLQLLSLVVLARLLGPADLGLAMLTIAVVYPLNALVEYFFEEALVQREQLDEAHVSTAFWVALAVAGGIILSCLLGGDWVARAFGEPELGALLRWMSPVLAFGAFNGVVTALLRRSMQFKRVAAGKLAGRMLGCVVAISMALAGFGVWSVIAQQLGLFGGSAVAFWLATAWRPAPRVSWRHLRELSSFAGPKALSRILGSVSRQVFSMLAGHLFGTVGLGYVALASRVSGTLGNILDRASTQISLSVFARQQHHPGALRASVCGATKLTSLLVLPIFTGLIVCADEAVTLAVGPQWTAAVPLVQLFAVGSLLRVAIGPVRTAVEAVGQPAWHLVRGTAELVLSVGGLLVLAGLGPIATGLVTVAVALLTIPIDFLVSRRFLHLRARELSAQVRWPLLASGLMAACLLVPKTTMMAPWSAGARLSGLVPLGALLYVGALLLLDRRLVSETVQGVRSVGTRRGGGEAGQHTEPPLARSRTIREGTLTA